jgi:hypothetical protein
MINEYYMPHIGDQTPTALGYMKQFLIWMLLCDLHGAHVGY